MPAEVWEQVLGALHDVEQVLDKRFGDPTSPLLVSCRSGAKFSMPGMMDTVLNIGLNDDTAKGLVALTGDEHFVFDSYRRLIQMFGTVVLGTARRAVRERAGERSRRARRRQRCRPLRRRPPRRSSPASATSRRSSRPTPPSSCGWRSRRCSPRGTASARSTTATPPAFPTTSVRRSTSRRWCSATWASDSATGVTMTRSGATGQPGLEGDFLINAQGEDVVSGTRATRPLGDLAEAMPEAYAELQRMAAALEAHYRDMQDIEFTIEDGKLWLLQTRDGKRTAQAAVRIAVDLANEGLITQQDAVRRVTPEPDRLLPPPAARRRSPQAGGR